MPVGIYQSGESVTGIDIYRNLRGRVDILYGMSIIKPAIQIQNIINQSWNMAFDVALAKFKKRNRMNSYQRRRARKPWLYQ